MSQEFLYIDNLPSLKEYCSKLKGSSWLAIDTEFEREKTYYPELCLLQITDGLQAAVIDPLVINDLSPLMGLIYDHSIVKVFHSARQDLEIFYFLQGSVPFPLFDTQLAAPLLGYPEQMGYGNLVKAILGVELSKSHTRTDWKRRPLNKGQLRYAVDDVIYLARIYIKMTERMKALKRHEWLKKDFEAMTDPDIYEPDTEHAWRRIRSANRLRGKKLSVLQSLAKWREETARKENCPRNWLLRDDAIIDISKQLPVNREGLSSIKGMHDRIVRKYGSDLLRIITKAQQQEPEPLPEKKGNKSLGTDQESMLDAMMAIVRIRAAENDLNPAILAPRKELEKLLWGEPSMLTTSWRQHMIGNELRSFLDGALSLRVHSGTLVFEPNPKQ